MTLYPWRGHVPRVAESAFVAPGAVLVGRVEVHDEASIWFHAVLRGDIEPIVVGPRSNVQDGCVLHTDEGFPLRLGAGVTVGHRAVLHGCTVEDGALIGMGAVVLNGAVVERGALVGAGALVPEGARIPAGHLALGVPARVVRPLDEATRRRMELGVEHYVARAREWRRAWADAGGGSR